MRTRIKFCGCTSARDAIAAVELGVDAVGVIFAPQSPRRVSAQIAREIAQAMPAFITLVGVFVEPSAKDIDQALVVGYIPQFSGNETAAACQAATSGAYMKVVHLDPAASARLDPLDFDRAARTFTRARWMLDTAVPGKHGGTGLTFDWDRARDVAATRPIVISGGLTPENVAVCIRRARPYGVDVRSGIETDGVKDAEKMRAFMRAVREADEQA